VLSKSESEPALDACQVRARVDWYRVKIGSGIGDEDEG
jgi:hypothetical protein